MVMLGKVPDPMDTPVDSVPFVRVVPLTESVMQWTRFDVLCVYVMRAVVLVVFTMLAPVGKAVVVGERTVPPVMVVPDTSNVRHFNTLPVTHVNIACVADMAARP